MDIWNSESKHIWIAELQTAEGEVLEYHAFELDPLHYETKPQWNEAHKSWSCHRQRERKHLQCNRDAKCKAEFAVSWIQPDSIQFFLEKPTVVFHKTIWDLYYALGYDYKTQTYQRPDKYTHDRVYMASNSFMRNVSWETVDEDIDTILKTVMKFNMDANTDEGFLRVGLADNEMDYHLAFYDETGVHGAEKFDNVRMAIYAWVQRRQSPNIRLFSFLGERIAQVGEKYGPKVYTDLTGVSND